MKLFYLIMAMTFSATITVGGRLYNGKNVGKENITAIYNLLVPSFGALGWLVMLIFDFSFDAGILPYSLLYGISYCAFTVGMLGALKYGSTSLTGLIKQISLVGVSFWGFFFWGTPFTLLTGAGIILTVTSLALCLLTGKGKGEKEAKGIDEKSTSLGKWLIYVSLVAVSNASCSIVQRYQQEAFDYQHKNAFMLCALCFSAAISALLLLKEKKHNFAVLKDSWWCPAITGISSALSNVFILLMIREKVSSSVIYPGIAVGGLMITTLIACLFFKERLRPSQWTGLAVGCAALVLLNL